MNFEELHKLSEEVKRSEIEVESIEAWLAWLQGRQLVTLELYSADGMAPRHVPRWVTPTPAIRTALSVRKMHLLDWLTAMKAKLAAMK